MPLYNSVIKRCFVKVSRIPDETTIRLPQRSTFNSAGYDFYAIDDVTIKPKEVVVVSTGVKAYMPNDEFLMLCNRSSNALKKHLVLLNGVGIVDKDFVDNPDNEGEIGFIFMNVSETEDVVISKGDKIGQGIFLKYNTIVNDMPSSNLRVGGFGSTGK